jgi:hypothetical protein
MANYAKWRFMAGAAHPVFHLAHNATTLSWASETLMGLCSAQVLDFVVVWENLWWQSLVAKFDIRILKAETSVR